MKKSKVYNEFHILDKALKTIPDKELQVNWLIKQETRKTHKRSNSRNKEAV